MSKDDLFDYSKKVYVKGAISGAPEDNPELLTPRYRYGDDLRPNPNVTDYDTWVRVSESVVAGNRERDKPLRAVLKDLMDGEFPKNRTELMEKLDKMDVRKDLVRELLEDKSSKMLSALERSRMDFSEETTRVINKQVCEYLALIVTLKDMGHSSLVSKFGQYDPYYADLELSTISTELARRRRNGCDIKIPFPNDYDSTVNSPKLDATQMILLVDRKLEGIEPLWWDWANKARKEEQEEQQRKFDEARAKQQGVDAEKRDEIVSGHKMSQEGVKK